MKVFVSLLTLIGLLMLLGVMTNEVYAPPPPNHYTAFEYAEHVLIGKILSVETLSEQKSQSSSDPNDVKGFMLYEIQIDEFLKNPLETNVIKVPGRYATEENPRSNIDPQYEINQKVLLYIQKDEPNRLPNYDLIIRSDESKVIDESISKPYFLSKSDGQVKHYFPLQQFQSGIAFNEIQCKEPLILIQKYDGSPACVTESTKQKLTERGWTGKETLEPTTYADCKKKTISSEFTLKKNTWISIAQLPSDKVKGDCTIITDEVLSQYDFLKNAIDGANDCKDDLIYCGGGSVTLERVYNFGVSISDSLDYELSLSKQQVESLLQHVTLTPTEDLAYGTIKHNDKHYQIILHTTNSNTTSHVKGKFASISEKPVPLQRGGSVDFTYSVESFATFGSDARIKLTTTNPARDSDLKINVVPPVLEIPERTQENATITAYAGKDAKDGIYQIRVSGRDADSGGLIRTDHLPSYPKVNVGNSSWEIFTYGNDRGSGFSGANPPPKWAWAELELNQDTFYDGDMMEIKAYLVNNGTKTLVLDEAKLLIQVIKATSDGYYSNLYGIDAELVDGETITVDPKSRELIARPFFWDQMTFNQNDESYRVDPAERKILMTLGHYNGTVWRDEISFVMK